jgi:hypothetical protein
LNQAKIKIMSQCGTINPELSCYISFMEKEDCCKPHGFYTKKAAFSDSFIMITPTGSTILSVT